jgi:hypothetical protein
LELLRDLLDSSTPNLECEIFALEGIVAAAAQQLEGSELNSLRGQITNQIPDAGGPAQSRDRERETFLGSRRR